MQHIWPNGVSYWGYGPVLYILYNRQLLVSTTLNGTADVCRRLEHCVSAVHDCCTCCRRLLLNHRKTEEIPPVAVVHNAQQITIAKFLV